jgi:hypothetical protein
VNVSSDPTIMFEFMFIKLCLFTFKRGRARHEHYRNPRLCRVLYSLSSAFCRALGKEGFAALPSAALGEARLSATRLFTECWTLGTGRHSAKTSLPSVKHSATWALGKGPSTIVPALTAVSLC